MPRLVVLAYAMPDGRTGAFAVDASVNEQHVTTATVTQHQVERGSPVSDFIRAMPRRLTLEAMFTNTPLALPTLVREGSTFKQTGLQAGAETTTQITINGQPV